MKGLGMHRVASVEWVRVRTIVTSNIRYALVPRKEILRA